MTFDYSLKSYSYVRNETTPYQSIYTDDEHEILVGCVKRIFGRDFTNEIAVRLDNLEEHDGNTIISISKVGFYDFLLTNFLALNKDRVIENVNGEEKQIAYKLYNIMNQEPEFNSVKSIVGSSYLSNILAVSCLMFDRERALITKRNGKVGISNDFISVSVTGSVDSTDFDANDPIKNACVREAFEELNFNIETDQLTVDRIVCGEKKTQPIAIVNCCVKNVERIVDSLTNHKGFLDENKGYQLCSKDELKKLVNDGYVSLTEAARRHIEVFINENNGL